MAETHIVLLFSILPGRSVWLVPVSWSANAAPFSVVLCHGCNCHLTLMQRLVKPFCTDNCALPGPLILKLNRKIFTAFSPSCLSTKLNTSLKLWNFVQSEDSSGCSLFLCARLFSMSLISCFVVEFIPLSLIFYFMAYLLIILPFVCTDDAEFCLAVRKGKWKLSDWELLPF